MGAGATSRKLATAEQAVAHSSREGAQLQAKAFRTRTLDLRGLLRLVLGAELLGLVLWTVWSIHSKQGLFRWLGCDYAAYFSLTAALWSGDPTRMYRLDALRGYIESLTVYSADLTTPLPAGAVPYPPLFAWLFTPFTLPSPPIGFGIWTGVNLLAALYLARSVSGPFPTRERRWVSLLFLVSFPVVNTLFTGQPAILLSCAFGQFFASLRAGREFRAGLWLSCLLFKPQYGILIGPLLLWKRQWHTVAGVAVGAMAVLFGSVIVAGLPALLAYPNSLVDQADFRGTGTSAYPGSMINWRSFVWLLLLIVPEIGDGTATLLTLILGGVTVICMLSAWRGPWVPSSSTFPSKIALVLLATLLANYHSHAHGAVLLAVPIATILATGRPSRLTRAAIVGAFLSPTLAFSITGSMHPAVWVMSVSMMACFASLLVEIRPRSEESGLSEVSPDRSVPRGSL